MHDNSRPQWTMVVTVFHAPSYGHAIELSTETTGRPDRSTQDSIGSWRGVGIPSDVLNQVRALVDGVLLEHMVERYGVAQTLDQWEVEPDPF